MPGINKEIHKNLKEYHYRAIECLHNGDLDEGIANINEVIRLKPKHRGALNSRGILLGVKNELDKALSDFNEVIRLDPNYAGGWNNRGNVWKRMGEYDKAIADYNEAIRLDPDDNAARINLDKIKKKKSPLSILMNLFA